MSKLIGHKVLKALDTTFRAKNGLDPSPTKVTKADDNAETLRRRNELMRERREAELLRKRDLLMRRQGTR